MEVPLRIAFRNLDPSAAIKEEITRRVADLERYFNRITACSVVIEVPHKHQRQGQGRVFAVHIDLKVPDRDIVVRREPSAHHPHEELLVAVHDAFDTAQRQLQDYVRKAHAVRHVVPEPEGEPEAATSP